MKGKVSIGGRQLGKALKTQVELSNRLTKAEKRFEDHKDMFLELYEVVAEIMAWYAENTTAVESMSVQAQMSLFRVMEKMKGIAQKAVVM
jgi:type III secretion system FlhB-like substrate exporter